MSFVFCFENSEICNHTCSHSFRREFWSLEEDAYKIISYSCVFHPWSWQLCFWRKLTQKKVLTESKPVIQGWGHAQSSHTEYNKHTLNLDQAVSSFIPAP